MRLYRKSRAWNANHVHLFPWGGSYAVTYLEMTVRYLAVQAHVSSHTFNQDIHLIQCRDMFDTLLFPLCSLVITNLKRYSVG